MVWREEVAFTFYYVNVTSSWSRARVFTRAIDHLAFLPQNSTGTGYTIFFIYWGPYPGTLFICLYIIYLFYIFEFDGVDGVSVSAVCVQTLLSCLQSCFACPVVPPRKIF
jgi:hypothetical protein